MSEKKDTRTATQKIDDLEKIVTVIYGALQQFEVTLNGMSTLGGDIALVKDALKLLNRKTEAIIQVAKPETGIAADSVSALVVKMNVDDLTAQVSKWVSDGQLAAADVADEKSYLVVEEFDTTGALASPRTQFRMDSLDKETADVLKGKKVGDKVSFGPNKFDAKILEIYTVTPPKAPEAAPQADAAPAPEAPAEAQAPVEVAPAEVAPAEAAPQSPALDSLPPESPVVEFVPSDNSTMMTANS